MPSQFIPVLEEQLCKTILEPLREFAQQPIIISSGYRCDTLNVNVGGAYASQHTIGEAADIEFPRPPIQIGMTIKRTPTRNLRNAGSHGYNPTRTSTNSSWKPPTVVTTESMAVAEPTARRTSTRSSTTCVRSKWLTTSILIFLWGGFLFTPTRVLG